MEHFTNTADKDISTKIREKRFGTVKEASTWVNDSVLALRGTGVRDGTLLPLGKVKVATSSALPC